LILFTSEKRQETQQESQNGARPA